MTDDTIVKKRNLFDRDRLDVIKQRDNCTFSDLPDKLGARASINFTCECGQAGTKVFAMMYACAAKCVKCTNELRRQKKAANKLEPTKHANTDVIVVKKPRKPRLCFNTELLDVIKLRDNCTFSDIPQKLNSEASIKFTCECGGHGTKIFSRLYNGVAKCEKCTYELGRQKMAETSRERHEASFREHLSAIQDDSSTSEGAAKMRMRYNQDLLDFIKKRDNCTFCDLPNKLTCDAVIDFYCECGVKGTKLFNVLFRGTAKCDKCTYEIGRQKIVNTCMERYGVAWGSKSPEIREKVKATNLERLGVEYPTQSSIVKEKGKQTSLRNYGVEHPLQSKEIRDRIRETCQEKYGVDSPPMNKDVQQRARETNRAKLGVDYPGQSEVVKDKIAATNVARYGCANVFQSEEIKARIKETVREKFGVDYTSQAEEVKQKIRETNLERFGVEHSGMAPEVAAKREATCLLRYDATCPFPTLEMQQRACEIDAEKRDVHVGTLPEFLAKREATCIEHWGTKYPSQTEEVKQRIRESNMVRYGVENAGSAPEVIAKREATCVERYGFANPFQSEEIKQRIRDTNMITYGVPYPNQNPEVAAKHALTGFRFKDYTFPSGDIIKVQGYEAWALDMLVEDGLSGDDIVTGSANVPIVSYEFNDKPCKHFVDIYIPSQRRMIEVKSTWTHDRFVERVHAKKAAAEAAGFVYEIWIFDKNKNRTVVK